MKLRASGMKEVVEIAARVFGEAIFVYAETF